MPRKPQPWARREFNIRMAHADYEALTVLAEAEQTTVSELVREAVRAYLKRKATARSRRKVVSEQC